MSKSNKTRFDVNTRTEIEFLNNIGNWSLPRGSQRDPVEVLKGYLRSCKTRRVWCGINKNIVIAHAEYLLAKHLEAAK